MVSALIIMNKIRADCIIAITNQFIWRKLFFLFGSSRRGKWLNAIATRAWFWDGVNSGKKGKLYRNTLASA